MPVLIGTSGWQYRHWNRLFYGAKPRELAELSFYSERFQTVEVNNTFYHLPKVSTFEQWRERVPTDFVMAVKASRYLTHIRRLREPQEPVTRLMERTEKLGNLLGPVLLQLPPNMTCNVERLCQTLDAFPQGVRIAVEFREASWFTDEVREVLAARNAALCIADRRSRLISPSWRTSDWGYLRFHEGIANPRPCYGRRALASRATLIGKLWDAADDVFVYFNNDTRGCALRDASRFAGAVAKAGLIPTRTPSGIDVA